MKIKWEEPFNVDILVIGGGTAGPMAALKAKKRRPELNILVIDKATVRRGGSICRGMDAFNNVTIPGIATVQEYVDSIELMSDGIANPNLNKIIAERSYDILKELEGLGVATFPKDESGEYMVQQFHPKGAFLAEMRGDIKPAMDKLLREHNVAIINRTIATRILVSNGRVAGAVLFNIHTGEFRVCRAKAVILCTGGQGRFALPDSGYLFGTFDCPYNAGEGYTMIYHAGGELTNMEYNDVSPMIKDYEGPGHSTFIRYGGFLVNSLEERFMAKYEPELLERAPSGKREQAMRTEIREGRGPIYYDLRHLPESTINIIKDGLFHAERPTEKEFFELKGIDIGKNLIEVTMSGPNMCGGHGPTGAIIDENSETNIKGLYAAGDVASTGWGFVGAAWVFGTIAGEHAANTVQDVSFANIDEDKVKFEFKRLAAPLEREDGFEPEQFEYKVRRIIKPHLTSPKSAPRLEAALNYIDRFRIDLQKIKAVDYHEVMKVIEIESIIDTLEMSVRASFAREESRWGYGHYRLDFPNKDPRWDKKYIIIVKDPENSSMLIYTKPVPSYRG